LLLLLTL